MSGQPRILLVHLFANGDCLYATTVARQIRQDHPGCRLTWAIAGYCKNIILNNPDIDEVLVIEEITYANWEQHRKDFFRNVRRMKRDGRFDVIVFTQIVDGNLSYYDQCLRSAIFRCYGKPVTVPVQAVLRLTEEEMDRVREFVAVHRLSDYRQVILFEFSPRSQQANFTAARALAIAKQVTANPSVAAVLSSQSKNEINDPRIVDGSVLSLRETAWLSNFCTLLVGCSSGVSWSTMSDAGKRLPMVQVLDPNAYWLNSVVNDHQRFGLPVDHIIEMDDSSPERITQCVVKIVEEGFEEAKPVYHTVMPVQFRITRGILVSLLAKGNIRGAVRHIAINVGLFGWRPKLVRSIVLGLITFPVKWIRR
jgi:hypothetical protein